MTRRTTAAGALLVAVLAALLQPGPATGGEEVPTCGGEEATVVGTDGPDVLVGTGGHDVFVAGGGHDEVRGWGGADLLCGGDGSDRLHGGAGADTLVDVLTTRRHQELRGGPGHDRLAVGWRDVQDGEQVTSSLRIDLERGLARVGDGAGVPVHSFREVEGAFGEGTWTVVGTGADERFTAHPYVVAATLVGGGGRDVLVGSWHDDVLRGGPGRDTAYPDRGRDTCVSVELGNLDACETRS